MLSSILAVLIDLDKEKISKFGPVCGSPMYGNWLSCYDEAFRQRLDVKFRAMPFNTNAHANG